MDAIVSVRSVSHCYGEGRIERRALSDVSVEIMPGEIVMVTGPSGSGKTTLLTLVGGLRSLQRGSIRTMGRELYGASRAELVRLRQEIGFVFQAHNLLPALTASQNVRMALEVTSACGAERAHRQALGMLALVGLDGRADSYPRQLSGGQRQRVAIARALARSPGMVLADEPTAALDKQSGREVVDLLHNLAKERGCAILLVTHDNRILDVADRILALEDGQISSFSSGLATNTEYLLNALQRKGELRRQAAGLAGPAFTELFEAVSSEFEQLTRTLDSARRDVSGALVDEMVETITLKLRQLLDAERASVYMMDAGRGVLRSKFAFHNGANGLDVTVPLGTGAAGRAAATAETVNVGDPSAAAALYAEMAAPPDLRPRSALCVPIFDGQARMVAVAELVNRGGGGPFTSASEEDLRQIAGKLGTVLERCNRLQPQEASHAQTAR